MNEPGIPPKVEYGGFWIRLGAFFLDGFFLFPLLIGRVLWPHPVRAWMEAETIAYVVVLTIFRTAIIKRWGGTPGKLICGLRVVKASLEPVGWREVWLRDIVSISLSVFSAVWYVRTLEAIPLAEFSNLSKLEFSKVLMSHQGMVGKLQSWAGSGWTLTDGVVLLCNSRRRAVHDYIAGTAVICKPSRR